MSVQYTYVSENYDEKRVDCQSIVDTTVVKNFRPHDTSRIDYTKPTELCCWHCCHPFHTPPLPLPHDYSHVTKMYRVFGVFCSFSCIKGYLMEFSRFDCSRYALLLKSMALQVYRCHVGDVIEAPPRIELRMFGGHMDIGEFRGASMQYLLQSPPFVPYTVVVEKRSARQQLYDIQGMRRMHQEPDVVEGGQRGMYFDFLQQQVAPSEPAEEQAPAPKPRRAVARPAPVPKASLQRFMKKES